MTRKELEAINNDRQLIDLRMQAEDLINNVEAFSQEVYEKESARITKQIGDRMQFLIQQQKEK